MSVAPLLCLAALFFARRPHPVRSRFRGDTSGRGPLLRVGALQSYLNDVICIPFWVPIMLWSIASLDFAVTMIRRTATR